jgi:preprotein translocase subunit SecG
MKPFVFLLSLITVTAGLTITVMLQQKKLMKLFRSFQPA